MKTRTLTISIALSFALAGGILYYSNTVTNAMAEKRDKSMEKLDSNSSKKDGNISVSDSKDKMNKAKLSKQRKTNSDKNTSLRSEISMRDYISKMGAPSEERKEKINHAPRYGEEGFEFGMKEGLNEIFNGELSEDKMKKIIEVTYELAYHHEIIEEDFADGKLSYIQYFEAMNENGRYIAEKEKKIFSEEEFKIMYEGSDEYKDEFDIEQIKKNQFISAFSNVNKEKYNIESAEDLDNYFTDEEKAKAIEIAEKRIRADLKLAIQSENEGDNFDFDGADKKRKQMNKEYFDSLRSFLSEEQMDILEGGGNKPKDQGEIEEDYEDDDDNVVENDIIESLTDEQNEALNRGEAIRVE